VFLTYIFRHSDQNDLIFLVISKTIWSTTEKKNGFTVNVHYAETFHFTGFNPPLWHYTKSTKLYISHKYWGNL